MSEWHELKRVYRGSGAIRNKSDMLCQLVMSGSSASPPMLRFIGRSIRGNSDDLPRQMEESWPPEEKGTSPMFHV